MTIAEKLTKIAKNSRALYEAGYNAGHIEGIDVRTVSFEGWHSGVAESELIAFKHGLGAKPKFVAMIADDISAVRGVSLPEGIDGTIIQTDALYNADTDEYCPCSYVRRLGDSITSATLNIANRLIAKWDEKYVYVNSAASSYAWAPSSVTTFTLICSSDAESRNVFVGIDAGEVVDNSIMKVQAIEFSFDDWFTAEGGVREIPHSLGVMPDEVLILPSHYEWNTADQYDGYFVGHILVAKMHRTYDSLYGTYLNTYLEYYECESGGERGYITTVISSDVLTWDAEKVTITPMYDIVFAPESEITYKLLVIKHT